MITFSRLWWLLILDFLFCLQVQKSIGPLWSSLLDVFECISQDVQSVVSYMPRH
jgi:hypothetical protein